MNYTAKFFVHFLEAGAGETEGTGDAKLDLFILLDFPPFFQPLCLTSKSVTEMSFLPEFLVCYFCQKVRLESGE